MMTPAAAMLDAHLEAHLAAWKARSELRPLARESKRKEAQAAEDRFLAARLAWHRERLGGVQ